MIIINNIVKYLRCNKIGCIKSAKTTKYFFDCGRASRDVQEFCQDISEISEPADSGVG